MQKATGLSEEHIKTNNNKIFYYSKRQELVMEAVKPLDNKEITGVIKGDKGMEEI